MSVLIAIEIVLIMIAAAVIIYAAHIIYVVFNVFWQEKTVICFRNAY